MLGWHSAIMWSINSNVTGRGAEVEFEKNAMMGIKFGARSPKSQSLTESIGSVSCRISRQPSDPSIQLDLFLRLNHRSHQLFAVPLSETVGPVVKVSSASFIGC